MIHSLLPGIQLTDVSLYTEGVIKLIHRLLPYMWQIDASLCTEDVIKLIQILLLDMWLIDVFYVQIRSLLTHTGVLLCIEDAIKLIYSLLSDMWLLIDFIYYSDKYDTFYIIQDTDRYSIPSPSRLICHCKYKRTNSPHINQIAYFKEWGFAAVITHTSKLQIVIQDQK